MAVKNAIVKVAFELYSSHVCEKLSNALIMVRFSVMRNVGPFHRVVLSLSVAIGGFTLFIYFCCFYFCQRIGPSP